MKSIICFFVICCLTLNGLAKEGELVGRINSVQKQSGEDRSGNDIEILKINTIQSGTKFKGVLRISVKLEDKNDQIAWGKTQKAHATGEVKGGQYQGSSGTGAVSWTAEIGHPSLKRPKIKAYTVEYGYLDNKEFVALDEEMYKTDSFDELQAENKDSIPLKCTLFYRWYVD